MELLYKRPVVPPLVSPGGRSPGKHVTPILRKIAIAIGVPNLEGEFPDLEPGPTTPAFIKGNDAYDGQIRIMVGLAVEEYLGRNTGWFEYHPGELELDDISGSPDGFSIDDEHGLIVEEIKFTDKSSRWNPLEDEIKWWMWVHQMMAYCHMADCEHGRLWALHNRGNYREERISFYQYLFHFDKKELEGVWRMILKNS